MKCVICSTNEATIDKKKDKVFNAEVYPIKVCKDCFLKEFPELVGKQLTSWGMNKYVKYAYQISDELYPILSKLKNGRTVASMISKYGQEEGIIRWNKYCNAQAVSNTFEYKRDKYGWTQEQFEAYNQTRTITLDNCIIRHGIDKGTKIFNDYCKKQSYAGCKLEYFIEKLGEEEGTNKYKEINASKKSSLQTFIARYGEFEGVSRWKNFCENTNKFGGSSSKVSVTLFDALDAKLKQYNLETYYSKKNKEHVVYNDTRHYFVDYYIKDLNLIVEFYGDYWHANPTLYEAESIVKYPHKLDLLAKDIWDKDRRRIDIIKSCGYDVVIVWESVGLEETVEYLFNLITDRIKEYAMAI